MIKRIINTEITATTVAAQHAQRAAVEAFIHLVFKRTYAADISLFMPHLVALHDSNGEIIGAFGFSKAIDGPLFLEQYLDAPIEQVMSEKLNRVITRSQITKIGNLAVADPRNAGVLIAHVIGYSLDASIEWCVATAHQSLQNGLIKGGRDVYPLVNADKAKLTTSEQAKWGSYYDRMPQVVAIRGTAKD